MSELTQPAYKLLKVAWIRVDDVPAGQSAPGRLQCPCKNAPLSNFTPGPDIICNCGRRYSWEGCIKGRSDGSDTLTAYRVTLSDGSTHCTSMAEDVNLQIAFRYFVGRVIDGKLAIDCDPC